MITLAALALRLSQLHQSLYGDELHTLQDVSGHTLTGMMHVVRVGPENSPPLFFVLAWFSAKLGDPTVWIRLPSLILGTATIPLVYLLGSETVGRGTGLVGAVVMAASPFSTFYGVEARAYATLAFLVVVSTLSLTLAIRTGRRRWWALYAVAVAAAAYTHYTAVFVLLTQALLSLWICRDRVREPVLANLAAALFCLPWVIQLHGKRLDVFGALEPLAAGNVLSDLPRPLVGYPYASLRGIPTIVGLLAVGICVVVGLLAALRARRIRRSSSLALLVIVAFATPLGMLLYSMLGTDIWAPRNLEASAPAASLVLAVLLVAIPGAARAVAVTVVVAILSFGSTRAITPRYARPQFRAAAEFIDRTARPGDPVILYPSFLDLTSAVPAQLHRPHPVLRGVQGRWPSIALGGSVYVIIDEAIARALRISTPHPQGFRLVARRTYTGLYEFTLLQYRAGAGTPSR